MNAQSHDRPGVAAIDSLVPISTGLMPIPPNIREVEDDLVSIAVNVMVVIARQSRSPLRVHRFHWRPPK